MTQPDLFEPVATPLFAENRVFPFLLQPSGAVFSRCGTYRPMLWRYWGKGPDCRSFIHFCALNPSTADHVQNDPTIRREIDFAKQWGFDGLIKTNAFDFRSPYPKVMRAHPKPCSDDNDWWIRECQSHSAAPYCVAAWGTHGNYQDRDTKLKAMLRFKCLGLTKDGHPKHPLYLPKTSVLIDLP